MKTFRLRTLRALVLAIGLLPVGGLYGDTTLPAPESTPDALVQSALSSELDGPSELRERLLRAALKRDSSFAPARWQLGFVRWDNEWRDLDRAARLANSDEQLTAYRKRRDALVDTADNHRALAIWCHKNKLAAEERIHWLKVLEFDPSDAEAQQALGLQLYNGRLLTRKQIEQEKIDAGNRLRVLKQWQPQVVKWHKAIEHGNAKERESALKKLRSVSDADALPALEAVFGNEGIQSNRLLIEVASRITGPVGTGVLLRRALNSDVEPVRSAAIEQLKNRPLYSFIPQLIAAMPGTTTTRIEIYVEPDGTAVLDHDTFQHGLLGDEHILFQTIRPTAGTVWIAISQAAAIERTAERQEQFNQQMGRRIRDVLTQTTDFKNLENKNVLLQQWGDYNDLYSPPLTLRSTRHSAYRLTCSCFPAGTPILTITGSMPIEKVKVGDRVLSQNPQTGELTYKPVQGVTLRPASPLVEIGVGPETIRATRGHPFWVNGRGWVLAKQLQVGQYLHGIGGAVPIDRMAEAPAAEAYNLVVSDFDTYFVGQQRLLVHDNLPLEETAVVVPGLRPRPDVVAEAAPTIDTPSAKAEQNTAFPPAVR